MKILSSITIKNFIEYKDCKTIYKSVIDLKESWLSNTDVTRAVTNKPLKKDTEDKVVTKVINSFRERSEQGINKYGTTLQRDDLSPLEWMQHLQEELMDATLYIAVLKNKLINLEIKEAEDKVSDVCD